MSNVENFRASRDVPLPYDLRPSRTTSGSEGSDAESQSELMSAPKRIVSAIAAAHSSDFERKKPKVVDSDDEDDDSDDHAATRSEPSGPS